MDWRGWLAIMLMLSCRVGAVDAMARTSRNIDQRFADEYANAANLCLERDTRPEYDVCMSEWEAAADAVRILVASTWALDVAQDRRSFEAAGCRWYRALEVVDSVSPVELPSAKVGLKSKWGRKC